MSGGHVEALEIANNFLFVGFEAQSILLPDVKVGMIHAWNLATPTNPPLEFHIQADLMPYAHSVCVTALKVVNGDVIVSGDRHGVIRLWKFDGTKFALTTTLHGHSGEITSLVMIDQLLWSSSVDRSIRLWDLSNNGVCKYLITRDTKSNGNPVGHTNAVTGLLTFNMPNNGGTFVLSSSLDGTIKAWNGTNGECVASEAHGEGVVSMALSEDQNKNPLLLVGLERGNIMVRNVLQTAMAPAFCLLFTLSSKYTASHIGSVKTIREGPSSTFYTGANDGKLMVWQISGDLGI
jgi:WD40 repeat protein